MSYSSLTNKYIPASTNCYSKGRSGKTVKKITWHHMAGNLSIERCGQEWQNPTRRASSNYGIGTDGRIACYVDEENRSWCSSSAANDNQAITFEIANDGGAPDWHVSDKAVEAAIKLSVDICKRYGIKRLTYTGNANGNFTEHRMFYATLCPGPYLHRNMQNYVDRINAQLSSGGSTPAPAPAPAPKPAPKQDPFLHSRGWWRLGDTDARVGRLAAFMRKTFPSYTPKAALGNYYGPNLKRAITEFQRRTRLEADGNTGPITLAKLKQYGFRG